MTSISYSFSGSIDFLNFVLSKYNLYGGSVRQFLLDNKWNNPRQVKYSWSINGIPQRAWNILHKDLLIIHLMGKININQSDLRVLEKEFQTS